MVVCLVILFTSLSSANAETISTWHGTTSYPFGIAGHSCAISSGNYIYCVAGFNGGSYTPAVYYGAVTSSGVTSWTSTTAYGGGALAQESCAISGGYIYCVGGFTGGAELSAVYYGAVTSSGVTSWTSTTSYPTNIEYQSCATYSGYLYCVGGFNDLASSPYTTTAVYYAPVSSAGVGTWTLAGNSYPTNINTQSCAVSGGYIYCVGGSTTYGGGPTNAVYYAQLSPTGGVGTWSATTSYTISTEFHSCATSSGYIYCVGGFTGSGITSAVYYGAATSSGITSWSSTAAYGGLVGLSCASSSAGDIYCVGGSTNTADTATQSAVDYALPSSSSPLTAPSAPTLSASTLDVNQAETVSGAIPSTGTAPYSWGWMISTNGGSFVPATQCGTNSGTGASASAPETCSIPANALTANDYYYFALKVTDFTTATQTSAASAVLEVYPALYGLVSPVSPTINSGQSVLLTPVPQGGTSSYTILQWYSGSSATCSSDTTSLGTSDPLSVSPTSNTYYCFEVTDTASATAFSSTDLVTVNPAPIATTTSVSCSPVTVVAGSSSTCTATVTGSSPTGTMTWSSSSGTGIFSSGTCALSGGSCAVTYHDPTGGAPVMTGSYGSDSGNLASSGTFILANFASAATAAVSTATTTNGGGSVTVNQQGTTGITTVISGAPTNTPVTVFSADLTGQPPGTGSLSITGIGFYDVRISGITSGTANVCILNAAVTASTVMQYYYLGAWQSATGVVDTVGVSICGNIPVLALNGTPIVLGFPFASPQFPFSFGLAAVFLVSIAIYALVRGTVGVRRPVVSTGRA